jgi:hypothetical protein
MWLVSECAPSLRAFMSSTAAHRVDGHDGPLDHHHVEPKAETMWIGALAPFFW